MKHIIILIAFLMSCISMNAQSEVKREGNTFSYVSNKSNDKSNDIKTSFKYKIKDVSYDVYMSKNKSFYIIRTSKKTGKEYKMYLPKEVQEEMRKSLK